jgi:hypothetical protein
MEERGLTVATAEDILGEDLLEGAHRMEINMGGQGGGEG